MAAWGIDAAARWAQMVDVAPGRKRPDKDPVGEAMRAHAFARGRSRRHRGDRAKASIPSPSRRVAAGVVLHRSAQGACSGLSVPAGTLLAAPAHLPETPR